MLVIIDGSEAVEPPAIGEYWDDPTIFLDVAVPTACVALGAFVVWLSVRAFSRRERWARPLWVATLVTLAIYLLSMGPVWWLTRRVALPDRVIALIDFVYDPIWWCRWNGPSWFSDAVQTYLNWWTAGA